MGADGVIFFEKMEEYGQGPVHRCRYTETVTKTRGEAHV